MPIPTTPNIWQLLRQHISDEQLADIARSDYDQSTAKHYRALRSIIDLGQLPPRLEWEPREVLSLCRWRKYQDDEEARKTVFFCSFCLLAAAESNESSEMIDGQIDNLILAIDTAHQLGEPWLEELDRFLSQLLPNISLQVHDDDYLYFHLAVYLIALMLTLPEQECQARLAQVICAERSVQTYWTHTQVTPRADILSYTCFDMRHALWRKYLNQFDRELEQRRVIEFGPFDA